MKKNVKFSKKALDPSMVLGFILPVKSQWWPRLVPVALLLFLNQF